MRLVRQWNEIDCGIATAAMVAGTSWTKACQADPNNESHDGLTVNEFIATCSVLGSPVVATRSGQGDPFRTAKTPRDCCAALIRKAGKHRGHFIAIDGPDVLDPELGRLKHSKYRRGNWLVVRWFTRA
jgi:hypothetical protein